MGDNTTFGSLLSKKIKDAGLTQGVFAKMSGLTPNTISNLVTGKTDISPKTFNKIIECFRLKTKVDITDLLNYANLQSPDIELYKQEIDKCYKSLLEEKDKEIVSLRSRLEEIEEKEIEYDKLLVLKNDITFRRNNLIKKEKTYREIIKKARVKVNRKFLTQLNPSDMVKGILDNPEFVKRFIKVFNLFKDRKYATFKSAIANLVREELANTIDDYIRKSYEEEIEKLLQD